MKLLRKIASTCNGEKYSWQLKENCMKYLILKFDFYNCLYNICIIMKAGTEIFFHTFLEIKYYYI